MYISMATPETSSTLGHEGKDQPTEGTESDKTTGNKNFTENSGTELGVSYGNDLECSIYQNYTASEVFVQGLAGVVNQQDVEAMIRAQKKM